MKTPYAALSLLMAILLLSSCRGREEDAVGRAARLMQERPDSALQVLRTVDRHSLTGERLARYALVYSIAQNKGGVDTRSDSLLRIAYDYYTGHPGDSLYARSRYYMGLYYIMVDSTKRGEDCLRAAARCAEERGEHYTQYLALNRLSAAVRYSDAPRAVGYAKQAYDIYIEHCPSNARNEVLLLTDIGTAYLLCAGRVDSALAYMDKALAKASAHGDSAAMSNVLQNMSLAYGVQKDYGQALSCAKAAWELAREKSMSLATCLADCYADADSVGKAEELYSAIATAGSDGQRYLAYKSLSQLSARERDIASSMAYSDSAYEHMERMYDDLQKAKGDYYSDIIRAERERLRQERVIHRERVTILCCTMLLVLVAMAGIFAYIHVRSRSRLRIEAERRMHRLREQIAREQYERDMAGKNARLTMMRALVIEKYDFHRRYEEQKKTGRHISLTDDDWEGIAKFLSATEGGFPERLRATHPGLREKDYQFCMLVRLGFSGKELADIYCISEASMKQKLVDYKKRLDIPDRNMSFKQYIAGL